MPPVRFSTRRHGLVWPVVCLVFLMFWAVVPHVHAWQPDDTTDETAAAATDETAAESPPEERSVLWWLVETSGWIGLILLILSIYFVAKTIESFIELRPEVAMPPDLVAECEQLLKQKDLMGVYKRLKQDESLFGSILSAGIAELPQGLAEARETMDRVCDAQVVEMERQISMLAVLGSLGPMIGLLGTLKGMIASFGVIALSDTQLKASAVAGGISEALVLTFEGVGLSVPAIYFFAVFRNRVASLSTSTLLRADEFLRRMISTLRPKSPATTTPGSGNVAMPPLGTAPVT